MNHVRWLLLAGCLSGCSTLDQWSAGRTDRLNGAPFYVTYQRALPAERVLVLPLGLDPLAAQHYLSHGRDAALAPLLGAIDDALASHTCCIHAGPVNLPAGAPELYVGSLDGELAPSGTGIEQASYEEYPPMVAHLTKPSAAWRQTLTELAASHGASRVVLVQLAFAQFPKADRGTFAKKVVLGTGYEEPIRFLSAVDKPVEVIELTGIVFDAAGEALRAGGEGIIGDDAPFWVQMLELGRDIDAAAIQRLTTGERRDDLPGRPLKWQAALDQLMHQLLR